MQHGDERAAIVTGAGSGIGAAVARRWAAAGLRVGLLGRTRTKLEAIARGILEAGGREPLILVAHQEEEDEVDAAVRAFLERFGRIDVLFNNAAIFERGGVTDTPVETWDRMLAVNVRGPLLLARAVVPALRRQGSGVIINMASTLGERPVAGCAAYSVSKAALLTLTRCLALEEAAHGIRVVAVSPGVVDTPIHEDGQDRQAAMSAMAGLHPLGRVGTADEVAALVDYLAGPEASWITGSVFTIDGGISLQ